MSQDGGIVGRSREDKDVLGGRKESWVPKGAEQVPGGAENWGAAVEGRG